MATARHARFRQAARGLTLIELLLVLAIVVIFASLALPNLLQKLKSQKLKRAADSLRTVWMQAHVRAMKTGQIQVFRYELGAGKFETKPWEADDSQLETSAKVSGFGPVPESTLAEAKEGSLPEGIAFLAGDARFENRSASLEAEIASFGGGSSSSSGNWSRPLLFFPDGSTSSAHVVLGLAGKEDPDQDLGVRVELRGLTGSVSVSDLSTLGEVLE